MRASCYQPVHDGFAIYFIDVLSARSAAAGKAKLTFAQWNFNVVVDIKHGCFGLIAMQIGLIPV